MALRTRLLLDLAELRNKPYERITLVSDETDINRACLVLDTDNLGRIHLTVEFGPNYPLSPPIISCDSNIQHPNIFGRYICASILNTTEGYTPAYTLKGIAIQLLSFFASDSIEQDTGIVVDLKSYATPSRLSADTSSKFSCTKCDFRAVSSRDRARLTRKGNGKHVRRQEESSLAGATMPSPFEVSLCLAAAKSSVLPLIPRISRPLRRKRKLSPLDRLPSEIIVQITKGLEVEELLVFAQAYSRLSGSQGIITQSNLIRNRELICFVTKESFELTMLGVGVMTNFKNLASEFDYLSNDAFTSLCVRRSVQGVTFNNWLPLPISYRHYARIKDFLPRRLREIGSSCSMPQPTPANVIYQFMNDVVVKLSQDSESAAATLLSGERHYSRSFDSADRNKTTLTHASEKAVESYYHLFHILLCLATDDRSIVRAANDLLSNFVAGRTEKTAAPNLGHLLLALLISDVDVSDGLITSVIREAVTRNVVWTLDRRGANRAELAYLEPDAVSEYRLRHTFAASKTSYRLLMFFNLFRHSIDRGAGPARKSLVQMRDALFDAHGAPPLGAGARLAREVQRVQAVNDFGTFFAVMGVRRVLGKSETTEMLRECVRDSMAKGYSVWGCRQEEALALRLELEPSVGLPAPREGAKARRSAPRTWGSFFPGQKKKSRSEWGR